MDYMFILERLKRYLLCSGIEPLLNQWIYSDHFRMLHGPFPSGAVRLLSYYHSCFPSQPSYLRDYIQEMHKYFPEHLVFQHLEESKATSNVNRALRSASC
jgi:hypothetical protein